MQASIRSGSEPGKSCLQEFLEREGTKNADGSREDPALEKFEAEISKYKATQEEVQVRCVFLHCPMHSALPVLRPCIMSKQSRLQSGLCVYAFHSPSHQHVHDYSCLKQ